MLVQLECVKTTDNSDECLIRRCLEGSADAWAILIARYRNLVYSIPARHGVPHDAAGDIFQQVCLTLFSNLARLREHQTLAAWLIQVTSHECLRWRRNELRVEAIRHKDSEPLTDSTALEGTERMEELLLREHALREALSTMPARCLCLLHMLFFVKPAISYEEVAERLGITKGSVSFVRRRCLERLRRLLEERDGLTVSKFTSGGN